MKWGRFIFVAAIFASGVIGSPEGRAADHSQIGCPLSAVSDAEYAALREAGREMARFDDPRVTPLRRAAAGCARRWNWSQAALNWAIRFHFSLAAQRGLRRWLVAAGVDVEEIGRMAREDQALIASAADGRLESDWSEATRSRYAGPLRRALRGLGNISEERYGDMAEEVGKYLGFVLATEALRRAFIAS